MASLGLVPPPGKTIDETLGALAINFDLEQFGRPSPPQTQDCQPGRVSIFLRLGGTGRSLPEQTESGR